MIMRRNPWMFLSEHSETANFSKLNIMNKVPVSALYGD